MSGNERQKRKVLMPLNTHLSLAGRKAGNLAISCGHIYAQDEFGMEEEEDKHL